MNNQNKIITRFLEQSAHYFGLEQVMAVDTGGPDSVMVPDYLLCESAYQQSPIALNAGEIR